MKTRHVFMIDTVPAATAAVAAARSAGIEDGDITLVANQDIEMGAIPNELRNAHSDFIPAALRGSMTGAAMGLIGGLIGMMIPATGLTLIGVALTTLLGATIGTWVSAMVGSSVPDAVHRRFASEIESGRILIVIDETDKVMAAAEAALLDAGASRLSYESFSALS